MPKELDVKKIENARQKKTSDNKREYEAQRFHDAFEGSPNGQKVGRLISPKANTDAVQEEPKKLRVAAYCRVSTQEETQVGSFELQKNYYRKKITDNPEYELVDIYEDYGISGTQTHKRKGYNRMIEDARAGKIDLILTKSISRLGRNVADILNTVTELNSLEPAVVVYFEQEMLRTDNPATKIILLLLASLAEMESQQRSESVKFGIRKRMEQGLYRFAIQNTIGYYRDYKGEIHIIEEEAEIVKYIYDSLFEGASPAEIAAALDAQGISSPMRKSHWLPSTILGILTNEKYYGAVLYQKTCVTNYITHKSVKNKELPQWFWENDHEAIIPKDMWVKAQKLITERAWKGSKKALKALKKRFTISQVKSGPLSGFYLIDMQWDKSERQQFVEFIKNKLEQINAQERN